MEILALGLNHKTAPVELREHLAFGPAELPQVLARLKDLPAVGEVVLLSTCNRTEVYVTCTDPAAAGNQVAALLAQLRDLPRERLEPHLYRYAGMEATGHLFRVAAGLDSMVLGETQVLGQVREAYHAAIQAGAVGKVMHHLLHQTLAAAKRAHSETGVGNMAVSVSYAAVELARKLFQTLQGRVIMAIGAGETAKLTVKHLQAAGAGRILVANRTVERAQQLASQVGGTPLALAQVMAYLPQVDVIISSTGAPGYVLTRRHMEEALRARRGRPVFLVDIAVPRDIDPECGHLDGAFLYDIDDLQQVVAANLQERVREARKAERILDEELERFQGWLRALEVVPTIKMLREKLEAIRQAELQKALGKLPGLSERDRQVVEAMSLAIVNKILNDPAQRLKGLAEDGSAGAVAEAVQVLFGLARTPAAGSEGQAAAPGQPAAATGER